MYVYGAKQAELRTAVRLLPRDLYTASRSMCDVLPRQTHQRQTTTAIRTNNDDTHNTYNTTRSSSFIIYNTMDDVRGRKETHSKSVELGASAKENPKSLALSSKPVILPSLVRFSSLVSFPFPPRIWVRRRWTGMPWLLEIDSHSNSRVQAARS